jgi:hypothetical protein
MREFGKMPEPLMVPGMSLFFGAVLCVAGVVMAFPELGRQRLMDGAPGGLALVGRQ